MNINGISSAALRRISCVIAAFLVIGAANTASAGQVIDELERPPDVQNFGFAVDIDGDTLVVGAPTESEGFRSRAFVYRRNGNGEFVRVAELIPPDANAATGFGRSVAIDGSTIAVGSRSITTSGLFIFGWIRVIKRI